MSVQEGLLAQAREEGTPRAPARVLPLSSVLFTLVRRELWEHPVLWVAPLAVSVLVILSALISTPGNVQLDVSFNGQNSLGELLGNVGSQSRLPLALFGLTHWALSLPLGLTVVLVLTFYLNDCLFSERRDRSILFWKSLPVSDLTTVTSKALLGLVLVPCAAYVLGVVTDLAFSGLWYLRSQLGGVGLSLAPWNTAAWLKVQALLGVGTVLSLLWSAPLGAYLLLVSAWARRNAFLWASLPPILAPLIERQALGTHYLWDMLSFRTFGMMKIPQIAEATAQARIQLPHFTVISPVELYDALPLWRPFTNIHVWLGVLVAVAMVYLAGRIRRHRDDS